MTGYKSYILVLEQIIVIVCVINLPEFLLKNSKEAAVPYFFVELHQKISKVEPFTEKVQAFNFQFTEETYSATNLLLEFSSIT